MGSMMKLWTSKLPGNILNIMHIHLNDTSEEATVDVTCITNHDEVTLLDKGDYSNQTFPKDASGKPLRYKILVYESKVKAVLYNTGSSIERVSFREMRIDSSAEKPQYVNV